MKQKIYMLFVIFTLYSCNNKSEKKSTEIDDQILKDVNSEIQNEQFDFSKFQILKGQLGEIKIGMTIKEADKFLKKLNKQEAEAFDFGFDGGGKASESAVVQLECRAPGLKLF